MTSGKTPCASGNCSPFEEVPGKKPNLILRNNDGLWLQDRMAHSRLELRTRSRFAIWAKLIACRTCEGYVMPGKLLNIAKTCSCSRGALGTITRFAVRDRQLNTADTRRKGAHRIQKRDHHKQAATALSCGTRPLELVDGPRWTMSHATQPGMVFRKGRNESASRAIRDIMGFK